MRRAWWLAVAAVLIFAGGGAAWAESARAGDGVSVVLLCTSFNVAAKGCQMDRDENRRWRDAAAPHKQDPLFKDILHELRGKTDRGEL